MIVLFWISGVIFVLACIAAWNMNLDDVHGKTYQNLFEKVLLIPIFGLTLAVGVGFALICLPFVVIAEHVQRHTSA